MVQGATNWTTEAPRIDGGGVGSWWGSAVYVSVNVRLSVVPYQDTRTPKLRDFLVIRDKDTGLLGHENIETPGRTDTKKRDIIEQHRDTKTLGVG